MATNIGYSLTKFSLYRGEHLAYSDVSFNHATGFCYWEQGYGAAEEPWYRSVFDVRRELRVYGLCCVGDCVAVSCKLTGGYFKQLAVAKEAVRILRVAGHFE